MDYLSRLRGKAISRAGLSTMGSFLDHNAVSGQLNHGVNNAIAGLNDLRPYLQSFQQIAAAGVTPFSVLSRAQAGAGGSSVIAREQAEASAQQARAQAFQGFQGTIGTIEQSRNQLLGLQAQNNQFALDQAGSAASFLTQRQDQIDARRAEQKSSLLGGILGTAAGFIPGVGQFAQPLVTSILAGGGNGGFGNSSGYNFPSNPFGQFNRRGPASSSSARVGLGFNDITI